MVCLLSALAYHELTTQIPHAVHVALESGSAVPRLHYPPLRIYWFSGAAWRDGVETRTLDGVPVRMYGPAKSVADAVKYRNKIGLDVAPVQRGATAFRAGAVPLSPGAVAVAGAVCAPGGTGVHCMAVIADPAHPRHRSARLVCGADDWGAIEEFGIAKQEWLEGFLELPHGIPCDETFRRVFARLDAAQFQERFIRWVNAVFELTEGQVIPVDGKCLRRSHDRAAGKEAIHVVSAWATENHLVLA